jgi:hypothetical protein
MPFVIYLYLKIEMRENEFYHTDNKIIVVLDRALSEGSQVQKKRVRLNVMQCKVLFVFKDRMMIFRPQRVFRSGDSGVRSRGSAIVARTNLKNARDEPIPLDIGRRMVEMSRASVRRSFHPGRRSDGCLHVSNDAVMIVDISADFVLLLLFVIFVAAPSFLRETSAEATLIACRAHGGRTSIALR